MDSSKLVTTMGLIVQSIQSHQKAIELMEQMVFAIAREHLKRNEVGMTTHDWEIVRAGLRYWLGFTERFHAGGRYFYRNHQAPTHIRTRDLKPVFFRPHPEHPGLRRPIVAGGMTQDYIGSEEYERDFFEIVRPTDESRASTTGTRGANAA